MNVNWAEQLQEHGKSLSRTEKQLVDYINGSPEQVSSMTLQELSEVSGISKPVVINCFRKLGFKDYKSFHSAIEQFFASQIDSLGASRQLKNRVRSMSDLLYEAASVDFYSIKRLSASLKTEDLEKISAGLNLAGTIYLAGEGTGHYPAHFLAQRLRRYGLKTLLIDQDSRHTPDMLHPADESDMIILFHYSDRDRWLRQILQHSAGKKLNSLLVSGTIHPDYVSAAGQFIHVPRGDLHFKNSMAVPMHFANLLLLAYEMLYGEKIEKQLTELEESRKLWD